MSKNTNKRARAAAVALTIVGVAGLSMAAAAQLNLTYSGVFQAGATTSINADCQPTPGTVTVKYDAPQFDPAAAPTPWKVAKVNFSGINAACQNKQFAAAYKTTGAWVPLTGGTVVGTSVAVDLPALVQANEITSIALTIYG